MTVDDPDRPALRRIGVVRSTLRSPADAPNQAFRDAPPALLEIDPAFVEALHLVRPGDELIVLTWLHLADRDVLRTHPTGNTSIPLTGSSEHARPTGQTRSACIASPSQRSKAPRR